MAEELRGVNGAIVRQMRERLNITPAEAAEAVGISAEHYLKIECGEKFPTYSQLKKIAKAFKRPSIIFMFDEFELDDIKGDLRTLPYSITSKFSSRVMLQFDKAAERQYYLEMLYGSRISFITRLTAFSGSLDKLALKLRELLEVSIADQKKIKAPEVLFELYRDRLYAVGIYVFKDSFKDNSVSGLCVYSGSFPVIVINNAMTHTRQLFTLFHEIYHLISSTNGAELVNDSFYAQLDAAQADIERRCDKFAGEFLVPAEDFKREISREQNFDDKTINELSRLYGVSREVIMYKLLLLNKIDGNTYGAYKNMFYQEAARSRSSGSAGGNHYATKLAYLGTGYTGAVLKAFDTGQIDDFTACDMLEVKVDQLQKLEEMYLKKVSRRAAL